jgi:hypothetical protein
MKFRLYRPVVLRRLMRPVNKRIRYRRYGLMILVCVFLTLFVNGLQRIYNGESSFFNSQIIPYYLIEKNYMLQKPLSTQDLTDLYETKEEYKKVKDSSSTHKMINLNGRSLGNLNKSSYLIYEFTKFNKNSKYCHLFNQPEDELNFYLNECPVKNCKFTCDKYLFDKADAVLFNEYDLRQSLTDGNKDELPVNEQDRNNQQIWALWNTDESQLAPIEYDQYKFNWTISYRQDSEVSDCSHGCMNGYKEYTHITEENVIKSHKKSIEAEFNRREDQLVFLVNEECHLLSPLNIAIDIDYNVYFKGKCKNSNSQSIPRLFYQHLGKSQISCDYGSFCEKETLLESKFILIYQSANCQDYVKNMFWRALDFGIIPIVTYPEKSYYEKFAPKNSFIHVEDFNFNSDNLGDFLKKISDDFLLYLNYFKWKFYVSTISDKINIEKRLMCEFCFKLNNEKSSIYYDSLLKWYHKDCKNK